MFVGLDTLNAYLWNRDNTNITFGHDTGGTKMSILYTGEVLIGNTVNNGGDLQVSATNTSGSIRIGGGNGVSNSRVYIQSAGDASYLDSYGGNAYQKFTINCSPLLLNPSSGGNVGIGTTSPTARFQVLNNGGNGAGGDVDYGILAKASSAGNQATIGAVHSSTGHANLNLGNNDGGLKFWHISKRLAGDAHRLEYFYNDGSFSSKYIFETNGTFTAVGDIVAYSDKRLKSNIKTLDGSKVLKMRGVSFKKDGKKGSGVIAQELEKVAPELVNNDNEYKGVAYGNLVGYLIEAIKELEARVKELENK